MVDSYERYWFQGMDAQEEFRLVQRLASKALRDQTIDDDLDASNIKHKH